MMMGLVRLEYVGYGAAKCMAHQSSTEGFEAFLAFVSKVCTSCSGHEPHRVYLVGVDALKETLGDLMAKFICSMLPLAQA